MDCLARLCCVIIKSLRQMVSKQPGKVSNDIICVQPKYDYSKVYLCNENTLIRKLKFNITVNYRLISTHPYIAKYICYVKQS